MCLRSSIDRFAIPCIYEIEGITTMPVSRVFSELALIVEADWKRYLDVVALLAWSAETPYGSSLGNAAHSAVRP